MNQRKFHIFLIVAVCAALGAGCSYHAEYPAHWPEIAAAGSELCPELAGTYRNAGERWAGEGCSPQYLPPYLSSYFFTDAATAAKAEVIVLSAPEDGRLRVEAENNGSAFMWVEKYRGSDYSCVDGWLTVSETRSVAENVSGWERTVYGMRRASDGSLIVQIRSSGAGVVFVVLVAGSATEWVRFEKAD
jgi:hypothetical protein